MPTHDPFSFNSGQVLWINPAWLYDIALSISVSITGNLGGGAVFTALLTAGLLFLITRHALMRGAGIFSLVVTVPMALLLITPGIAMRPQMITFICVFLTYAILHRAREKPFTLYVLPLVALVWANMHGGAPLALVLIAAFGLEALLLRRFGHAVRLLLVGCLVGVVSLLNPYGIALYEMIQRTFTDTMIQHITEWQSPMRTHMRWAFLLWVLLFVCIYRPRVPGVRLADHLVILGLLAASFLSERHVCILGVLAAAPSALMLSYILRNIPRSLRCYQFLETLESRLRTRLSGESARKLG